MINLFGFKKTIYAVLSVTAFFITTISFAQTTLSTGDIAFTGYNATPNAPQNDAFSFVILVPVTAGTVIRFTDQPWGNDNAFNTVSETTVSFTFGAAQPAGKEITIAGPPGGSATATLVGGASAGTCTGTTLSLSVNGDQVIAYQSATAGVAPFTFLSAIHMNVATGTPAVTDATNWDNVASASQTANSSFKPTGLVTGSNALWIGTSGVSTSERNNARFNCTTAASGGANLSTAAGVRAACNNQAFWDSEFAGTGATPTWIPPSGCTFLGIVPVKLVDFSAQQKTDYISLNWQTENQTGFSHFEVERSYTNRNFSAIATIGGLAGTNGKYNFDDKEALQSGNPVLYYRLRIIDRDGRYNYSPVVAVKNNNTAKNIFNLVSPVTSTIKFDYYAKINGSADIRLTDLNGRVLMQQQYAVYKGITPVSVARPGTLPGGTYLLQVTAGTERTVSRVVVL